MTLPRVLGLALVGAVGLGVVPLLLPAGPTGNLGAAGLLESGQIAVAALVVFAGGLVTSLTPCVYPLIPITVGVFGASREQGRGRSLLLVTAYVVGMGVVFASLGVAAALSGKAFGSILGSQWLAVGLAVFLIVLATSMFGAFEIALPSGVATRLNSVGGAGVLGALLMGSVAGFLAAPCTGPVLASVLAWVSTTRDPFIGGGLLFTYALGIGVPFFLIGVFTIRLPKSGPWMEWIKSMIGVALLALAVGYLRDAFPEAKERLEGLGLVLGRIPGGVLGAALAFAGVLLGAIHLSFRRADQRLAKALGVVALVVAFTVRTSALSAPSTTGTLLAGLGGAGASPAQFAWTLEFNPDSAGSLDPFSRALHEAQVNCRPVMIDFFAEWCAACKELDRHVYSTAPVMSEAERFVTVKVDGTNDHPALEELYQRFQVEGLPTVAFVDPTGAILRQPRVNGFLPAEDFVREMRKVAITTCARGL